MTPQELKLKEKVIALKERELNLKERDLAFRERFISDDSATAYYSPVVLDPLPSKETMGESVGTDKNADEAVNAQNPTAVATDEEVKEKRSAGGNFEETVIVSDPKPFFGLRIIAAISGSLLLCGILRVPSDSMLTAFGFFASLIWFGYGRIHTMRRNKQINSIFENVESAASKNSGEVPWVDLENARRVFAALDPDDAALVYKRFPRTYALITSAVNS